MSCGSCFQSALPESASPWLLREFRADASFRSSPPESVDAATYGEMKLRRDEENSSRPRVARIG